MQRTVEGQAHVRDLQALRTPGWDSRVARIWVETWGADLARLAAGAPLLAAAQQ